MKVTIIDEHNDRRDIINKIIEKLHTASEKVTIRYLASVCESIKCAQFIDVSDQDLVVLHASNDYSSIEKEYLSERFVEKNADIAILCYSEEPGTSWYRNIDNNNNRSPRCYTWEEVQLHIEEFLLESKPGNFKWEVFEIEHQKQKFIQAILPIDILVQGALILLQRGQHEALKQDQSWWKEARDGLSDFEPAISGQPGEWLKSSIPGNNIWRDLEPIIGNDSDFYRLIVYLTDQEGTVTFGDDILGDEKKLLNCHRTFEQIVDKLCV